MKKKSSFRRAGGATASTSRFGLPFASLLEPLHKRSGAFLRARVAVVRALIFSLALLPPAVEPAFARSNGAEIDPGASTALPQAGETGQSYTSDQQGVGDGSAASCTYDLSLLTVADDGTLSGTIKVKHTSDGSDASGVAVNLSYATSGGTSATPVSTDLALGNTGATGEVRVTGNVTALPRKIRFTANSDGASAVTRTVGTIPTGFLTGVSVDASGNLEFMAWGKAKSYCSAQGGHLPLVNNTASYPSTSYTRTEPVEGFGNFGAPWPAGLPGGDFWTGTEAPDFPGDSWIVGIYSGNVGADGGDQTTAFGVVCVP